MLTKVDPKSSIRLLDELARYGFNNELFAQIHHFNKRNAKAKIPAHIRYCQKTNEFQLGGTNELVQQRLFFIRNQIQQTYGADVEINGQTLQRIVDAALATYPL